MIDLRSDTLTQPSAGMRQAMAEAVVGDEQKREDPTVTALEERAAELLGQEEAVYLPTATMANQIALRVLSEPGDEVVAEAMAHVFRYELGGPAVHSGLAMKPLQTENGIFTAEQVRDAVSPPGDLHTAPTRLVCFENTHNGGGGKVWPIDHRRAVVAEARRHDLRVHLDGARLMNAAVASGNSCCDQLLQILCNLVRFQLDEAGPLISFGATRAMPPELRERVYVGYRHCIDRITDILIDGISEGSLRPVDPLVASQVFIQAITAAHELKRWVPGVNRENAMELYVRPVFTGVLGVPLPDAAPAGRVAWRAARLRSDARAHRPPLGVRARPGGVVAAPLPSDQRLSVAVARTHR